MGRTRLLSSRAQPARTGENRGGGAAACREATPELIALPGIGPYTAAAIGSIAFGLPLAVLDGNVMRVLTRVLALQGRYFALPQTRTRLQLVADEFLDEARSRPRITRRLMELGATVCLPRKPMCLLCPLNASLPRPRSRAEEFPVKVPRRAGKAQGNRRRSSRARVTRIIASRCPRENRGTDCGVFPTSIPHAWSNSSRWYANPLRHHEVFRRHAGCPRAKWRGRVPATGRYLTREEMQALAFAAPHRKLDAAPSVAARSINDSACFSNARSCSGGGPMLRRCSYPFNDVMSMTNRYFTSFFTMRVEGLVRSSRWR